MAGRRCSNASTPSRRATPASSTICSDDLLDVALLGSHGHTRQLQSTDEVLQWITDQHRANSATKDYECRRALDNS